MTNLSRYDGSPNIVSHVRTVACEHTHVFDIKFKI